MGLYSFCTVHLKNWGPEYSARWWCRRRQWPIQTDIPKLSEQPRAADRCVKGQLVGADLQWWHVPVTWERSEGVTQALGNMFLFWGERCWSQMSYRRPGRPGRRVLKDTAQWQIRHALWGWVFVLLSDVSSCFCALSPVLLKLWLHLSSCDFC